MATQQHCNKHCNNPCPQLSLFLPSDPQVRTGDLVLMQSEAFTARFVTHAMRCEYAHLAIVVRLPKLPGTVLLLEP